MSEIMICCVYLEGQRVEPLTDILFLGAGSLFLFSVQVLQWTRLSQSLLC